tara:strand:+ start:856 stop:1620 length:765 start_codon:yes stop_codon:yes gene_type:complete
MSTEQEKLAYELGCAIALSEYQGMTKEAFSPAAISAISNAWKAGTGVSKLTGAAGAAIPGYAKDTVKFLAGFKGPAPVRTLGSATGFGLMGAAGAEEGNRLKGFTGGFLGGLAFSGASSLGSRLGKGLNASRGLANQRWMGSVTNTKKMEQYQKTLNKQQKLLDQAIKSKNTELAGRLQNTMSKSKSNYNAFLKSEGVNRFDRTMAFLDMNKGKVIGGVAGFGGGMYASGIPEDHFSKKMVSRGPSNVFTQGYV